MELMFLMDAYLTFASIITGLFAFVTAYLTIQRSRDPISMSLGAFWIAAGGVWFCISISVLFMHLENSFWAMFFAYAVFVFVVSEGPLLAYHFASKLSVPKAVSKGLFLIFAAGMVFYLFFLFRDGIPDLYKADWGYELHEKRIFLKSAEPESAHTVFTILFGGITILALYDLFSRLREILAVKRLQYRVSFVSTVCLIAYMIGGLLFLLEFSGTILLASQLLIMMSVFFAFLNYLFYSSPEETGSFEV